MLSLNLLRTIVLCFFLFLLLNPKSIILAVRMTISFIKQMRPIHLAWLLLFCSVYVWRLRSLPQAIANPIDTATTIRMTLFLSGSIITFIYLLILPQSLTGLIKAPLSALFLFCLFGIATIAKSPNHLYTLWKVSEVFVDIILASVILNYRPGFSNINRFTNLVLTMYFLFILNVLIQLLIVPHSILKFNVGLLGIQFFSAFPLMDGDGIGNMSCVLAIALLARSLDSKLVSERVFYSTWFVICFAVFFISQARTALIAFVLALSIILVGYKKRKWLLALTFLIILTVLIQFFDASFSDYAVKYVMRDSTTEQFLSFSGRVNVWRDALHAFSESPFLGYGFATGTRYALGSSTGFVHNSFLEVLINSGLLGLFPFLICFVWTWSKLIMYWPKMAKSPHRGLHIQMTAFLAIISVSSITSSAICNHDQMFMFYLTIVMYAQFLQPKLITADPSCARFYEAVQR